MAEGTAETALARRHIIRRPRLTQLLDGADTRVVVVVAPAGYGKTTLLREWLESHETPAGWFSASDAAVDVAALALGVARAASSVVPGVETSVRRRLDAMRETAPNSDLLADLLAAELEAWPTDAWLVIDDYQSLIPAARAEAFVGRLADLPLLNLAIASRARPAWATARRLLYGEVREIGRPALAMTADEAMAVLANRQPREAEGLAALAEGWPAVIGLAAISDSEVKQLPDQLPETLHEYFAQELFNSIPDPLRPKLVQLAIPNSLSENTLNFIGGHDLDALLGLAARHGFVTAAGGATPEIHPLLRRFLRERLQSTDGDVETTILDLGTTLINAGEWDEAFSLIETFNASPLIAPLIDAAIEDVLRSGRVATLERWVAAAGDAERSPQFDLAKAEISFREGRYSDSELVATRAAAQFPKGHRLVTRAWYRAAQSAHLDGRLSEALSLHRQAEAVAPTKRARRDAIWGQFISQSELDLTDDARATLRKLQKQSETADDFLREAQARISLGMRWDGLNDRLLSPADQAHLSTLSCDPVVQTAYLHMLGCALALHAQYFRALEASAQLLTTVDKFRLDFVTPHALYVRALALIGLRQFGEARKTINSQARHAAVADDQHSYLNSRIVIARIALAQRRAEEALTFLESAPSTWPTPGLAAEWHGIRALALAVAGRGQDAGETIATAQGFSAQLESEIPCRWAEVVAASGRRRRDLAGHALERTEASGHLDTFILSYRADPTLLSDISDDPTMRPRLQPFLEAGSDQALARRFRIAVAPATSRQSLTQREAEVFDLLRQGMRNSEISRTLWISEATTKVHVRRVLEKLGVKSRVEAATLTLPDDS